MIVCQTFNNFEKFRISLKYYCILLYIFNYDDIRDYNNKVKEIIWLFYSH